ncbi:MAG: acetyl-CoA carboxylase biotin carboxylase subunit [Bacteroidetes bacterium 4572_112]|nr:MAG: acetyl-CoA carboxylase biotin carboxylase subunit [Bacteroidetes bacterium 4572_112]
MIKKILIANRGEIAIRVMHTCREMGIKSVAVFSDVDRTSQHVRLADEAYHIGAAPSAESYLVIDKIIDVAKRSGADAIHPGYGFLSENAEFSDRCKAEGIIFIGPTSKVISVMGDKISARKKMIAAGVQVVPGTKENIKSDEEALRIVKEVGLPVMIKASAGGGGKGMRLVRKEEDIISGVRAAKSEALAGFGDDTVYVEKYVENPHHIEVQVLGDSHGNVIHLFERECSVQRRHQKVMEESPSPLMTPELREKMGNQAVMAAKAVDYIGAGTVEFLVDDDLNYYFLEMNTRLQVEHPITEQVTRVDLVRQQIQVAAGMALEYKQEDLSQLGHSIEARIYAENPCENFMPSPGLVKNITVPLGPGIRHDGYIYSGYTIPIHYDPMISKLIVTGKNREQAIERMKRALYNYKISGVKTNIRFLNRILETPEFVEGNYNTQFIDNNIDFLKRKEKHSVDHQKFAVAATFVHYINNLEKSQPTSGADSEDCKKSEWKSFGRRKNSMRL